MFDANENCKIKNQKQPGKPIYLFSSGRVQEITISLPGVIFAFWLHLSDISLWGCYPSLGIIKLEV